MYIFCYKFRSIVNSKPNFWDYNEKHLSFHLTQKILLPGVELQWEHPTLTY